MKKLLLILLCVPLIGLGQGWEKIIPIAEYSSGSDIKQTIDGGYIVTGWALDTTRIRRVQPWLLKMDDNGDSLWFKWFPVDSNFVTQKTSVIQTIDGGYAATGRDKLSKYDSNGNILWSKSFVFDTTTSQILVPTPGNIFGRFGFFPNTVQHTSDGGYILAGQLRSVDFNCAGGYYGYGLLKTDNNGDLIWVKSYDSQNDYYGYMRCIYVEQTQDGGYISCGQSVNNTIVKTDGNGDTVWTKNYMDSYGNGVFYISQTTDGGYIFKYQYDANTPGLVKLDNNGDMLWHKALYLGEAGGCVLTHTNDGGYIAAGRANWHGPNASVLLIKYDSNLDTLWTKNFFESGGFMDVGAIQQTNDGGYVIIGRIDTLWNCNSDYHLMFIKTNSNGSVTSEFSIPINTNRELKKTVDILGRETKEKKNTPLFYIYDDGTVEKKIIIE